MKKTLHISAALALTLGFPLLSSCDSGPVNTGDDIVLISRGFDLADIAANPANTAVFPPTLATGEVLTLTVAGADPSIVPGPLTFQSSNQFVLENNRYNFLIETNDTTMSTIVRSSTHRFTDGEFKERTDDIVQNSNASAAGSLAEVLQPENFDPDNPGSIIETDQDFQVVRDALILQGYTVREVTMPTRQIEVLRSRVIRLESTSTNALLTSNTRIDGTYEITSNWSAVVVIPSGDVQEGQAPTALSLSLSSPLNEPNTTGEIEVKENGTFQLQLNSLTTP